MSEGHVSTVAWVADAYLCCSCGACELVCPENAVSFEETKGGYCFPSINRELCTQCGQCLRSCSGISLSADLPDDPFAGEALGCWIGKSSDLSVYSRSQSGGAVTAILLSMMSEGRIEGALTVIMKPGTPPRPEGKIAFTPEEIIAAQGSKYSPVPVLNLIKDLNKLSGPVALVGLSCHVHGVRNIMEEFPELREKVNPVIGLICDRVMAFSAIDYLVWKSGTSDGSTASLEFRSKEWRGYPGDVRVGAGDGRVIFLPGKERRRIKDYFTPARCRLCFDKMNVFSDLTAGDPWGIPGYNKERGESILIARTIDGVKTVRSAIDSGFLELREINYDAVLMGQNINKKREEFSAYCSEWMAMNRPLPAQSEAVLNTQPAMARGKEFKTNLLRATSLDQFNTRIFMFKDVRRWLNKQRILKKIKKNFPPIFASRTDDR